MILSDGTIRQMLSNGDLYINPEPDHEQIQPGSIDLTLGRSFLKLEENQVKLSLNEQPRYCVTEDVDEFVVPAHGFVLATTEEYIKLPADISGFIEGRSSIGRMGLFIQNAGWVDPGFEGKITLELVNITNLPIKIFAGRRICQIVLAKLDKPAIIPYGFKSGSKYQFQDTVVGSKIHYDTDVRG